MIFSFSISLSLSLSLSFSGCGSLAMVDAGRDSSGSIGMLSLAVMVEVGCGLLVVNAAVLGSLYCKRGRLGGKMREQLTLVSLSLLSSIPRIFHLEPHVLAMLYLTTLIHLFLCLLLLCCPWTFASRIRLAQSSFFLMIQMQFFLKKFVYFCVIFEQVFVVYRWSKGTVLCRRKIKSVWKVLYVGDRWWFGVKYKILQKCYVLCVLCNHYRHSVKLWFC